MRGKRRNIISECSKFAWKEYKTSHNWMSKVIHCDLCKKLKFKQMVDAQPRIRPREWDTQTSLRFWDTNGSPNLSQTTRSDNYQQKKRTSRIVDFTVPVENIGKLKGWEKRNKYLDLARELKKIWNLKVMMIPIVIGALGTFTKWSVKGLEDLETKGRVETIQTTALLRLVRILGRVLETCHPNSSEKQSANAGGKNSQINNYFLRVFHSTISWSSFIRVRETPQVSRNLLSI